MDNYCGKRLDGRYELREIMGVGGMAVVYKAYDNIDDRIVAVKILKDEYLSNEDFRRRFKNESKAIAVLSHPNIVKVFDVSYGDRMQYIVMEFVEGITLKEYMGQQGRLSYKEIIYFMTQILRALQHAHDKGIVHRDIKPQNIMLLENGTIKVTDFGIARFSRSETQTMAGSAVGSVHYISPEQAKGETTDNKADIYSVGVMLYEMLTGRLPFEGESTVSVALMQLQQEPKRPREIDPSIPIGLEQITMRAMQKRKSDRYQSASEMLMDLDEFRRNPRVQFNYNYFVDEAPTRHVPRPAQPQQRPPQRQPQQRPAQQRPQPNPRQNPRPRPQPVRPAAEEEDEESGSRTLPVIGGIIGGMLILAVIIVVTCFATGVFAKKVAVPNFVGMNYYEEIQNNDAYAAFNIKLNDTVEKATYEQGVVYEQSPSARVKIRPKEEIVLYVPKVMEKTDVPDVYGYTFTDAITLIEAAGFETQISYEKDSGAPEQTVIRTQPERATQAAKGTTVVLYVAAASDTVAVPKIVGYDLQTARELVQSVGLDIEVASEENSDENKDVVLRLTNYREETQVPKGTVISVVVSNGKPAEATAKVSFRLPDTGEDGVLKVYLGNELQSDLTKTLLLDGSSHAFDITSSDETKKLTVKINDSTYYECLIDFTQTPAKITSEKTNTYVGSGSTITGKGILPSVEGFSYDEAYETLTNAGFTKIKRNDVATGDASKNDLVFQQTPPYKAFTRYAYSTEIVLSVYKYEGE
ncbi:MAG: Stk1 family PASTA domain-containing Ser/Thr kinase [Oscillospiraceae bacterium]|nr:Stk1 family PASTA domain-containing Ser/Thr kinase [Oscillospiraceae bacterium]